MSLFISNNTTTSYTVFPDKADLVKTIKETQQKLLATPESDQEHNRLSSMLNICWLQMKEAVIVKLVSNLECPDCHMSPPLQKGQLGYTGTHQMSEGVQQSFTALRDWDFYGAGKMENPEEWLAQMEPRFRMVEIVYRNEELSKECEAVK